MKSSALWAVLAVLVLRTDAGIIDYGGIDPTDDYDRNSTTVPVGQAVIFPCDKEIPVPIVWKKQDPYSIRSASIDSLQDDRFEIVEETSLKILSVVPTDSGRYTCQSVAEPSLAVSHTLKVTSLASHDRQCPGKSGKWIDLGGDYCYLIDRDAEVSWIEAVYQCFLEGGSLVTFKSMEELQRIMRYLKITEGKLYIGLWKHNDGGFEWVDKSLPTFRNWEPGEPNDRSETCVEMYLNNGKWNDIPCSREMGYLCSDLKRKPAAVQRKVCPDTSLDWTDLGTEHCYIINLYNETTSQEAAERCSAAGGSLASFHSIEEISVVRNQIRHHHDRLHIGFRQNSDGMFQWMDRSPADLEFWDVGEPNDVQEMCSEIYPSSGLWNDIPCSKRVGYICSTPKVNPEISVKEPTPSSAGEICGGVISSETGTIQSPNYPENYNRNENCFWKITVPDNHQIQLSFLVLKLEYGADCEFDYVEVRDGEDPDSPVLRKFCGSNNQQSVRSSGNTMAITFSSDLVNQDSGFLAEFKAVPPCGGIFVAEEGVIQSPNYPYNYANNHDCTWKITVPENNAVLLKFKAFGVEESDGCGSDYVVILDGHDATSGVIGRYCGSYLPFEIRSSGHKMTVIFVSDDSKEYFGFLAEFKKADLGEIGEFYIAIQPSESMESICRRCIDYEKGTLVSPHYPDFYKSGEVCIWTITAPQGSTISLRFKSFQLESSSECRYDSVTISDGPDITDSARLGFFCGDTVPDLVTSSGNQMTIKFDTDSSSVFRGFAAVFKSSDGSIIEDDRDQNETCDGCIIADEGVIQSPNYPENYGPSDIFTWKITVSTGHQVVLKFNEFKVETHRKCAYDHVLVLDGHEPGSRVLAKLCGYEIPSEIRSSGNKLMVEFKSDSSIEYIGFAAEFRKELPVVPSGSPSKELPACGEDIHADKGTISSPNFPSPYEPLQKCIWKITVPEGNLLNLKFETLNLEVNQDCSFDSVTVYDGDDTESPVLNTLCEDSYSAHMISSKNKITVNFTSDDTFEGSGFTAVFQKILICGENIVADEGVIESPNITDGSGYRCSWRIIVPDDFTVLLKMKGNETSILSHRTFAVAIYNGPDISSPLLREFTALHEEDRIRSTGNKMFVIVTSEGSEDQPHFYAEFQKDICGRNITADSGVITSGNYPDNYPSNEDCTWRITVEENYQVLLKFQSLDLEGSSCLYDFVEVRDGHTLDSNVIGRYCGTSMPPNLLSTGNRMSLRFVSDSSVEGQGFSADFEKSVKKDICGGSIEADRGVISSPDFPSSYPKSSSCTWSITVPEGNIVVLQFNSFSLEYHDDCRFDSLKIYEGHDVPSSYLLGTLCGDNIPDTIRSTTNEISLTFVSDASVEKQGFTAEFIAEPASYPGLEDMLREFPNVIFQHAQKKPKPSRGDKKKKKKITKRSLLDNLQKIFKLGQ